MMINEYLTDPCRKLSIPYWKAQAITIPNHMRIIHAEDFCKENYPHHSDNAYFRLKHDLQHIPKPELPSGYTICAAKLSEYAEHINHCYERIGTSKEELYTYTQRKVYDPSLWLAIQDISTARIVASGIAEIDRECGEGILEWIQVSKDHRHRGLGSFIVSELLRRMTGTAKFATVSGRCDDPNRPDALYRKCGFYGNDVWHILTLE